ncbi:hypothetical protein GCM10023203_31670 [Actinomycetospora straminea]|uniref:Uncharacterized protein n=1 Tax=Actinomycetospora straminea TaxID=663607 RepID=A0ABP9EGZ1_9PSEU
MWVGVNAPVCATQAGPRGGGVTGPTTRTPRPQHRWQRRARKAAIAEVGVSVGKATDVTRTLAA